MRKLNWLISVKKKQNTYVIMEELLMCVYVINTIKVKQKSYFLVEHVRSVEMLNRYRESINQTDFLTVKPRDKDFRF